MSKQSVLLAGILLFGITVFVEYGELTQISAQDNARTANGLAVNSDSELNQTPDAKKPANETKAANDIVDETVVTGVVLKPDGSPAAQATIRSIAPLPEQLETRLGRKPPLKLNEATADADGRFSISINKAPYGNPAGLEPRWQEQWKTTPIVASLKGFGSAYVEFKDLERDQPAKLRLVDDQPIRGQIIDLEGSPVNGATIQVGRVQAAENGNLDRILNILNEGKVPIFFQQPIQVHRSMGLREIDVRLLDLPEVFRTDKDGRFEIHGLGKERIVHLTYGGGEVASGAAMLMTREMETIQPKSDAPGGTISNPIFGSNLKLVAAPSRAIEGTVVDADTGEPLPGVSVHFGPTRSLDNGGQKAREVVTDQAGHFRLAQLAKGAQARLQFVPADDQPYFPGKSNVPDSPGFEPIQITMKLHRGLWIKGRITNKATHEPVPGVVVHYYPFKTNNLAGIVHIETSIRGNREEARSKTDTDGMYRVVGVAGPGIVTAESLPGGFRTGVGFKELNMGNDEDRNQWPIAPNPLGPRNDRTSAMRPVTPQVDDKEVRLDFELDPGLKTRVRFVDANGEAVKNARAFGQGVRPPANSLEGFPDGTVTIENLGPDEKRILHAHHPDRELGVKFEITPPYDEDREITVALEPMAFVTGRLLEDGKPIVGAGIGKGYRQAGVHYSVFLPPQRPTDSEGRFRTQLIPGHAWSLEYSRRGQGPFRITIASDLNVRAGETIDLGDLELDGNRFKPVKANALPEKPAVDAKPDTAPPNGSPQQPEKSSSNPKPE